MILSQNPKPVIGLIGGIGSGKSTVARQLVDRGGVLIAGDQLGHEALRQPDIRQQIVQRFGAQIQDERGDIDRKRLGAIVFADQQQRRALEAIVFPYIERGVAAGIAAARADPTARFIVLDAAVMLEAGWDRHCSKLIFVDAPPEIRLARLGQRGLQTPDVAARENAQWPLEEKKRRADAVVTNSGPLLQVAAEIGALLHKWGLMPDCRA